MVEEIGISPPETGSASSPSGNQQMESGPPTKKKRNLPGMPDPDAEVIALSPKSLLARNKFVCEICSKGFQRDQNLQLHRRGHNLPWKLRQRTGTEVPRKRVYVCPEPTCIHHDPKRALGDLTGIKKHYCRKHGEKNWQCKRCSKKYAVQSDWKAHMKTCGSKEYICDCGTKFSRRDSFTTHRAFCEVLAEDSAKSGTQMIQIVPSSSSSTPSPSSLPVLAEDSAKRGTDQIIPSSPSSTPSPSQPALTLSSIAHSPVPSIQSSEAETLGNPASQQQTTPSGSSANARTTASVTKAETLGNPVGTTLQQQTKPTGPFANATTDCTFASIFTTSTTQAVGAQLSRPPSSFTIEPMSLSLSTPSYQLSSNVNSLFPKSNHSQQLQSASIQSAALSATALLQKAAQIGATSTTSSFLRGLGLEFPSSSLSSTKQHNQSTSNSFTVDHQWNGGHLKGESSIEESFRKSNSVEVSCTTDPMVGTTPFYGNKPTTLDLFGLGLGSGCDGGGGSSADRFSALLSSIEDGLDAASAAPFGGVKSKNGVKSD